MLPAGALWRGSLEPWFHGHMTSSHPPPQCGVSWWVSDHRPCPRYSVLGCGWPHSATAASQALLKKENGGKSVKAGLATEDPEKRVG